MKCAECNLFWKGPYENFPSCKADPNWPVPCECEIEEEEVEHYYTLDDLGSNWW